MKYWVTGLLLIASSGVYASEAQLKVGNRLFLRGHYEEALKQYNDALIDAPDSSVLRFNAGDAAYQLGQFPEAHKHFAEAADKTPNPLLKSAARYNQGNALFRQNKWKDAVEAYKDALRANPRDEDAKYNLGVAMQVLKNPSQAPKQPQPDKGDQKKQEKANPGEPKEKKPGEMNKEDAERLLSAAGAGEKKKQNGRTAKPEVPQPDEDW